MTCSVYYATSPDGTPEETHHQTSCRQCRQRHRWRRSKRLWRVRKGLGRQKSERQCLLQCHGHSKSQDLSADTNFKYKKRLNGRFKYPSDPRVGLDGSAHPISDILITNICKKGDTGDVELQLNANGTPIVFEVMSVDPFIDPWGNIEYYKLLLESADDQQI